MSQQKGLARIYQPPKSAMQSGRAKAQGWLLEYAPPQLHLVLGSRLPVPLPMSLARLRSQGQLGEFDLRDLRFSLEETNRYLCEQLGSIDRHAARHTRIVVRNPAALPDSLRSRPIRPPASNARPTLTNISCR